MAGSNKRKKKSKKRNKKRSNYMHLIASDIRNNKVTADLLYNLKMDLLERVLVYCDEEYTKLETKISTYYIEIFDIRVEQLRKFIFNSKNKSFEEINTKIQEYINKWISEVNALQNTFGVSVCAYAENLIKNCLEETGKSLVKLGRKENFTIILKKFVEDFFNECNNYYEIYSEEINQYGINLFLSDSYKVESMIKECLKAKELKVEEDSLTNLYDRAVDERIYLEKYKELNSLAQKNGYEYKRSNGGHGIFYNKETNKTVIIPQGRKIGKGLSLVIQKQMQDSNEEKENSQVTNEMGRRLLNLEKKISELSQIEDAYKEVDNFVEENSDVFGELILDNEEIFEIKELAKATELGKYIDSNELEEGIKHANDFISKYPQSKIITALLGGMYYDLGKFEKAIAAFKKHVDLGGEVYDVYEKLIGLCYSSNNEIDAETYKKIAEYIFHKKVSCIEEIYMLIDSNKSEEAVELIQRMEEQNRFNDEEYAEIGRRFFVNGCYTLSVKYNDRALGINSENEQAKGVNLAITHMKGLGIIPDIISYEKVRSGKGESVFPNGDKYTGDWKDGLFHGKGRLEYNTGSIYTGDFVNGQREGIGTYVSYDGNRYVGNWKRDIMFGEGILYHANGQVYMGKFSEAGYAGKGRYTWPDGCIYIGDFKDDKMTGNCTYTWPDGTVYKGGYKNGLKHGIGTMYYNDGEITTYEYRNEEKIRVISSNWSDYTF